MTQYTRGAGRGRSRRPASSQDVCLSAVTWGKAAQAAAELGTTVDELCEGAVLEYLQRAAAQLFEREFRAEQAVAAQVMTFTPNREEYRRAWRPPAWSKP